MVAYPRTRMTPEEFKQLPESNQLIELIDGEVIVSPTPVNKHQKAVGRFFVFLDRFSETSGSGEAVLSPMDVWLGTDCVQPDVFWVGENSLCKLGDDGYWYGAPELVIEVLSPSTARRDRQSKYELYQRHGVREYWLVDPEAQYIEVLTLENGKFSRLGVFGPGQSFHSPVLSGALVEVDQFFRA